MPNRKRSPKSAAVSPRAKRRSAANRKEMDAAYVELLREQIQDEKDFRSEDIAALGEALGVKRVTQPDGTMKWVRTDGQVSPNDGPISSDRFIYQGKTYGPMPPGAWELVNLLWAKSDRSYPAQKAAHYIVDNLRARAIQTGSKLENYNWGSRLRGHKNNANKFFTDKQIPIKVRTRGGSGKMIQQRHVVQGKLQQAGVTWGGDFVHGHSVFLQVG